MKVQPYKIEKQHPQNSYLYKQQLLPVISNIEQDAIGAVNKTGQKVQQLAYAKRI